MTLRSSYKQLFNSRHCQHNKCADFNFLLPIYIEAFARGRNYYWAASYLRLFIWINIYFERKPVLSDKTKLVQLKWNQRNFTF